ncbi:MAG TPA: DEAD/DEAH box helicase [Acholeplasmataceae bacterium]|jgi:ATP-dependent RNA helicase CshB|nr:DEAD/DEAH box helicase [Acholeplasmataceae bacterium]HRX45415.1 DEAD/DEAH box helicase [Acholeplasmataceae bacterium]
MTVKEMLSKLKYHEITPIQKGVFNAFNSPKHLVGLAPTGTGKTHAYLLPILAAIDLNQMVVQALIIVPTNELVLQVHKMLMEADDRFIVKTYYGGTNKMREQEWLKKYQPQIVIATPQQIVDYVNETRLLRIHQAKYVVFDEADMMFDEAFLSMIDQMLPAMEKAKYLLFSATLNQSMTPFIKTYFGSYDLIDTSKQHDLKITYKLINIKHRNRLEALSELLEYINPYLGFIFVSKKENQDLVYEALLEKNISVCNLNASMGVKKRTKLIEDILALKYQYVVTSDLAARGLDFKISHVIHYDLPHFLEFYMHRSGRTGRMNDTGEVITFMTVDDHRKIEKLKEKGIVFQNYQLSSKGLVKVEVKKKVVSEEEINAIKKVKKATKVTPGYKKKRAKQIKKIKQEMRKKQYVNQNR